MPNYSVPSSRPTSGNRHHSEERPTRRAGRSDHSVHRRRWHRAGHLARQRPRVRRGRRNGVRRQAPSRVVRGARRREGEESAPASGCRTTRSRPCKAYKVAIKGPLTTPVGGGIRSLNVTLRQVLDLYACVRPVRYFTGTPSPVTHPERMNVVIFRENTEDVYAGIEWAKGTPQARAGHRVPVEGDGQADCARLGHRHQADVGDRHQAARPHGDPVRPRQQAQGRHARAQGQHHEVHRGRLPGLGLRAGQGRVPRPDRHRGRGRGTARRARASCSSTTASPTACSSRS